MHIFIINRTESNCNLFTSSVICILWVSCKISIPTISELNDTNWGHGGNKNTIPSSFLRDEKSTQITIQLNATKYLVFLNGELQVNLIFIDITWLIHRIKLLNFASTITNQITGQWQNFNDRYRSANELVVRSDLVWVWS